jgi:hypothetical protein
MVAALVVDRLARRFARAASFCERRIVECRANDRLRGGRTSNTVGPTAPSTTRPF